MRSGWIGVTMVALALTSCEEKSAPAKQVVTATSATASTLPSAAAPAPRPHGRFELAYAIYTSAEAAKVERASAALESALKSAGWKTSIRTTTSADAALPDEDYARGLVGDDELAKLKKKKTVVVIGAHVVAAAYTPLFPTTEAALLAATATLDGHVWDQSSWSLWTPEKMKTVYARWDAGWPFAQDHISVQFTRSENGDRFVTAGLSKFGLPELLAEGSTPGERPQMTSLMNLAAQTLLERMNTPTGLLHVSIAKLKHEHARKRLRMSLEDGATGEITLGLADAKPGPHDPDAQIIRLSLPGAGTPQASVRAAAALEALFGVAEDETEMVDAVSDAWKAASKRAVEDFMARKAVLQKGLRPLQTLHVKVGFPTPDGSREWMWVDVMSWKGTTLRGRLANVPKLIPDMQVGQELTIRESDVADFVLDDGNGTKVGNYTGKTYD